MKTLKTVLILMLSLGFLLSAVLFLIGYFKPKPGGVLVDTSPAASVYINGLLVGETPYKGTFEPQELSLKLVAKGQGDNLPFETRLLIVSGTQTVVRREFGPTEEASSGDIISFEKEGGGGASLVVISTPENAQVSVDGVTRGFAPYKTSTISAAEHQITVKALGFNDRIMTIKTIIGYRLTVFAKLSKASEEKEKEEEEPKVIKTLVEILETPTGYLRVRSEPGPKGIEIDQLVPGSKYLFLEEDASTGWYKILLEPPVPGLPDGRSGWVSNQYSKKIEEEVQADTPL